jgi:hypothetical protein
MAILIKCNATDLADVDELTFTLPKEKGMGVTRGLEVFIWISEKPRKGPKGTGLEIRGHVTAQPREGGTVVVRVSERVDCGVMTMSTLGQMAEQSEAAHSLYGRIKPSRHRRIWGLAANKRDLLHSAFDNRRGGQETSTPA